MFPVVTILVLVNYNDPTSVKCNVLVSRDKYMCVVSVTYIFMVTRIGFFSRRHYSYSSFR